MDQNQVQVLIGVPTVGEMEEFVLIKDFLPFNKHVHNVQVVEKKLQILVLIVMGWEINRHLKKYL